jgi:hypothetical protein
MIYTFYVTIGATTTQVYPLNFLESSLVDEPEGNNVFYRRKFNGSLLFCNLNGANDFTLLLAAHTSTPCVDNTFEIKRDGSTYWAGKFSTTDGKFDMDKYTFEVTPSPDDDYETIFDGADTQYDLFLYDGGAGNFKTTIAYIEGKTNISYTRGRRLEPCLEGLCDSIMPGSAVSSTFFGSAINPATLTANQLLHLLIFQKSDVIRPTATNPAPKALMSFNEMMDLLWGLFQVKWTYSSGVFTIEHISFFTGGAGIDLRSQIISDFSNQYTYLKEKMPKYEKFVFSEANGMDFTMKTIWYDSQCVNNDSGTNDKQTTINVTTDLEYIITDPSEISDSGFVILCNELVGGTAYYVKLTRGAKSYGVKLNGHLSWANLHNSYFRHNRILEDGYMNDILTAFWTVKKNKKQEINAIICPTDGYDPTELITTEFGETYLAGEKGKVEHAELRPTGETKFSVLYGTPGHNNTGISDESDIISVYQVDFMLYATLTRPTDIDITITIEVTDCLGNPQSDIIWTILTGSRYSSKSIEHCLFEYISTISGSWTIGFYPDDNYICT